MARHRLIIAFGSCCLAYGLAATPLAAQGPGTFLQPSRLPPVQTQRSSVNVEPTLAAPQRAAPEVISAGLQLEEIEALALGNNPSLQEAATQVAAARGRAQQASLYPNPMMSTASPQLAGNQSMYNVFWSQEVVTRGKLRLSTEAALREAQEAELRLVRARFDLLTTVRQRYYTALAAQARVDVLGQLVDIARKSHDVGIRLFKGGEGSRTDAILLDIELDRSEVAKENAATLLEANKRQLAAAAGVPDLAIARLGGDLNAKLPSYEMIAVQQGVISQNALARIAEVEVARSNVLLDRARVEPFPNFNFMGGWQYQLDGAGAPNNQGIYQVSMSLPLWNRNQGAIRAAQATVGTSQAQLGRVRNELAGDAAAALGRYLAARQMVERYESQIVPKARETQRLTQQAYSEGQLDFLRLLQSQRTLVEVDLGYINSQESRWMAASEVAGLLQTERFP